MPEILRRLARRRKIHSIMALHVRAPCKASLQTSCLICSVNNSSFVSRMEINSEVAETHSETVQCTEQWAGQCSTQRMHCSRQYNTQNSTQCITQYNSKCDANYSLRASLRTIYYGQLLKCLYLKKKHTHLNTSSTSLLTIGRLARSRTSTMGRLARRPVRYVFPYNVCDHLC